MYTDQQFKKKKLSKKDNLVVKLRIIIYSERVIFFKIVLLMASLLDTAVLKIKLNCVLQFDLLSDRTTIHFKSMNNVTCKYYIHLHNS